MRVHHPTPTAWTFYYKDREGWGSEHAITISDVEDEQTPVLVDGELATDSTVEVTIQNPQDKG
jgi:hypothetical protein